MYKTGDLVSLMTVAKPRTLLCVVQFKSQGRLKTLASGMAKRLGVAVIETPATEEHIAWAKAHSDKCRRNLGLAPTDDPAPSPRRLVRQSPSRRLASSSAAPNSSQYPMT